MAENSKIEWTDHTFNPWVGCQKVSPGCDHCYAEGWAKRSGLVEWGPHGERRQTSEANWRKPFKWDKAAKEAGRRDRVFCASLADWLDNRALYEWRVDLAMMIEATPNLDWLLLTKRPENFEEHSPWLKDELPPNVWLGVTAENQQQAERRGRILREIPARVRFLSCEPLLSDITFEPETMLALDMIIVGGESGHGARMMQEWWAEHIMDQCRAAGVHFFMKQMTGKRPIPPHLMVREMPTSPVSGDMPND